MEPLGRQIDIGGLGGSLAEFRASVPFIKKGRLAERG